MAGLVHQELLLHLGSDVDEDVVGYLSGLVVDCEEEDQEGLVHLLGPFLESYELADSEEASIEKATEIVKSMVDKGMITFEGEQPPLVPVKLLSKVAEADSMNDEIDTWDLANLVNRKTINTQVDSIGEALGNSKRDVDRQVRKAEKEKKKEDQRVFREELELKKAFETSFDEPVTAKKTNVVEGVDVIISNYSMSIGSGKLLLDDAELRIIHGHKYGMLGRNGVGKTTLLRHISHKQIEGFPTKVNVLHVEQEVVGDDNTVLDLVLKADTKRERLLEEERVLMNKMEAGDNNAGLLLTKVYDEMTATGAYSAEARARGVLAGLSFPEEYQTATTKSLSGGWRMRVALARALFVQPDILMLDEPTNHLDLEACIWLERYLQKYKNTLILVTHDRKFANNIITDVIHLEHQKLNYYKGDIDTFEQTRSERRLQQQRQNDAVNRQKDHMQKFVDKFRFNAKRASLVQSRIKAINKLGVVDELMDDPLFRFSFPAPISELNKVIEVQDVSFGYGENGFLFENVDFSVFTDSRVILLGPNGCGKSTFLNLVLEKIQPKLGYIQRDPKVRMAHFAQHHVESLDLHKSPLDHLLASFQGSVPDEVRSHLSRYGIPAELATQRIGLMSGGQKSRVAFAYVTWNKPHILVMDEPTNHLDLETVEALIIAIGMFEGGVIMVSHDQHFIEMAAEEFWVIKDRKLSQFKGSFEEYKKWAMPE